MNRLLFIDLDGVLVDFVAGALAFHKSNLLYSEAKWDLAAQIGLAASDFWNPLGREFWEGLQPTREMVNTISLASRYFGEENTFVISSPCRTPGCATGKAAWVEKHLPPSYSRHLLLTDRKEIFAGPGRLLIDDFRLNCQAWEASGCKAFLFPRPWNEARDLESLWASDLRSFLKVNTE